MNNYNINEERKKHPYLYYGKVIEEKHGNGMFLLKSALKYVIDDYDENINSIEQSHYEDLGYSEVVNFNLPDSEDILDLTWMKKDDVFKLEGNKQYPLLKEVIVNVDNLGYSKLPNNIPVLLTVKGTNSESNIIQIIKNFQYFIQENANSIKEIKLKGFNSILEYLLTEFAKKNNIEVYGHTNDAVKNKI